jgi:hypothetical protein
MEEDRRDKEESNWNNESKIKKQWKVEILRIKVVRKRNGDKDVIRKERLN